MDFSIQHIKHRKDSIFCKLHIKSICLALLYNPIPQILQDLNGSCCGTFKYGVMQCFDGNANILTSDGCTVNIEVFCNSKIQIPMSYFRVCWEQCEQSQEMFTHK